MRVGSSGVAINVMHQDREVLLEQEQIRTRPWRRFFVDPSFGRICAWPGSNISTRRVWYHTDSTLGSKRDKVKKVVRVRQRDGRIRFDIFCRTGDVSEVMYLLRRARALQGWGWSRHISYSKRRQPGPGGTRTLDPEESVIDSEELDMGASRVGAKIVSWNIRSIKGKRRELDEFLERTGVLVAGLQETCQGRGDWPLRSRGFQVFETMADRDTPGARGLALMVDTRCPAYEVGKPSKFCVAVRMTSGGRVWNIVNVYIPPKGYRTRRIAITEVRECVMELLGPGLDANIIVMGDWNARLNKMTSLLARWRIPLMVTEVSGSPLTRHGGPHPWSAIDHILCSEVCRDYLSKAVVDRLWSVSDHFPIQTSICHNQSEQRGEQVSRKLMVNKMVLKENAGAIKNDNLWTVLEEGMEDMQEEEILDKFLETTEQVLTNHGALGGEVDRKPYLIGKETRKWVQLRRDLWVEWLQKEAPRREGAIYARYLMAQETVKKVVKKDRRKSWLSKVKKVAEMAKKGAAEEVWKWVKNMTGGGKKSGYEGPVYREGNSGEVAYSPEEKLKVWEEHYGRLAADPIGKSRDREHWRNQFGAMRPPIPHLESDFKWDEISSGISSLKHGAPGFDGITADVIKMMQETKNYEEIENPDGSVTRTYFELPNKPAGKALMALINRIWNSPIFSDEWNVAWIVSVPKKGDPKDTDNYRGISLISILVKFITSLVTERVTRGLETSNFFIKEQAGFRWHEESNGHTCALYEILCRRRIAGDNTYVGFVDIKKAYDTVPTEAMLRKLECAGVRGKALKFFRALYSNASIKVKTGYGLTERILLVRGLRQGCNASPMLFDVFINDIFAKNRIGVRIKGMEGRARVPGLLFADDTVLLAESAADLRSSLRVMDNWAVMNGMSFGVDKCGIMGVGPEEQAMAEVEREKEMFVLGGRRVPVVRQYVYLGLVFTHDLDLTEMARARALSGKKILDTLRPLLGCTDVPIAIRSTALIKVILIPKMTFGGELWGMKYERTKMAEKVVYEALKVLGNLRAGSRVSSIVAMGWDLKIPPPIANVNAARVRAIEKYTHLQTVIADLIDNPMRSRFRTWVSGTTTWIKRNTWNLEEIDAESVRDMTWRNRVLKGGSLSKLMLDWKLEVTNKFIHRGMGLPQFAKGIQWLWKLRCGAIWSAERMARVGVISGRYVGDCPFCHWGGGGETMEHLVCECSAWATQRKRCIEKGRWRGARPINFFGGVVEGCGWSEGRVRERWLGEKDAEIAHLSLTDLEDAGTDIPGYVRIAAFLYLVMPIRMKRLQDGLTTNRADAELGRAVLEDNGIPVELDTEVEDETRLQLRPDSEEDERWS